VTKLRVGITGSGSAGPAAAALLARQGHEVELFERAPAKEAVGAGFLLQPTGMSVLKELGILDRLLPYTARINHLFCQNTAKTTLLDLHYDELQPGLFGAGTYRPALLDLLLQSAETAGARIRWNHEIILKNNHHLEDLRGSKHGPFDLILICDGARSTLRDQAGIPAKVDRYPWGALWFIGKRPPDFDPHTLWQAVEGTQWLNGYLPTGTDNDYLSLFWSIRMDELAHWKSLPVQTWKDQVLRLTPQAEDFLQQVEDMSQLQPASYFDVRMKQWHGNGVAILGDAAHALSPQLGQGVNLALMDASTLASCIGRLPLNQALAEYSRLRKKHLNFYQFASGAPHFSNPISHL